MNNVTFIPQLHKNTIPIKHIATRCQKALAETAKKVYQIAKRVLKAFRIVLLFPKRYIGSKTWSAPGLVFRFPVAAWKNSYKKDSGTEWKQALFGSGYHYNRQKILTREETTPYLKFAAMTATVHSSNLEWIEPFGYQVIAPQTLAENLSSPLPGQLEPKETCFFDPKSGLKIMVLEKDNNIIVVFGDADSSGGVVDDKKYKKLYRRLNIDCAVNILGGKPKVFSQASRFVEQLKTCSLFQNKTISLCGQCLGGALASYSALQNQLSVVCLNPVPLGPGLQEEIGSESLNNAEQYINNLSATGDFVSDNPPIGWIDRMINLIGIKTAGNFGKKVAIPSAFKTGMETHCYILGSIMNYLGHNTRTKPIDLKGRAECINLLGDNEYFI